MSNNIVTSNQFMDKLVQYLKELSLGTIIKNEEEANRYETLASAKDSDLFLACMDNFVSFGTFLKFDKVPLERAGVPAKYIPACIINKTVIPQPYREACVEEQRKYTIETYVERNNYYRMLNGLPDMEDLPLYYSHPDIPSGVAMHELSLGLVETLRINGTLGRIIESYPDKRYLRYLGSRKIPLYNARRGNRFSALYVPECESNSIREKYMDMYEKNRIFTLKTVYSEAFKYSSNLYDNFIEVFIIVQTVVDMINDLPEIIIRKEFFDEESIRDMFLSHGITYFSEIPFRYQLKMVKNLNTLLKYKSTTKNMVDICKIFGFENVEIFKYYLLKDRKMTIDGDFAPPKYILHSDNTLTEVPGSEYDLKFVKMPIDANPDDYIRNTTNHLSYEELVYNDIFWNGPDATEELHLEIKQKIIDENFNYVHSKYLSIDTIYDLNKLSFELCYLFNLIIDNIKNEEILTLRVREISYDKPFRLSDILIMLFILMYERYDIEDDIMDTSGKILHITGFNFEANMSQISSWLATKGYTLQDVGIDGFTIPQTPFVNFNDLMKVYINNKKVHDHLVKMMATADRYHIYKIYRDLYDALMISDLNTSTFKDKNGNFAGTYTNYIKDRDPLLYDFITNLRLLDSAEKNDKIIATIDGIILALEEYLHNDEFDFQFANMTNISSELVKGYLYKVINFFKSYTVDLLSLNTIFIIEDKDRNKVNIVDDIWITSIFIPRSPASNHDRRPDEIILSRKGIYKHSNARGQDDFIITPTYS